MRARLWALVGALALLSGACGESEPPKAKVIVLGFDGAGWDTMEPLIEAGELPLLARLREESAWGRLETFKPTKSPVIWTSVATGKEMAKHGILDFVFMEQNDIQVPYSNSERREPSIWQILNHYDKRSVVVNWFVTYPPDDIEGVMISNRFRKTLLLSDERRRQMADAVHPPHRYESFLPFLELDYERVRSERELPDLAALHESLAPGRNAGAVPVLKDYRVYVLQEALIENVSRHLVETESFDFFATYFRLPDIVQHMALELVDPALVEDTLSELREGSLSKDQEKAFQRALAELLAPFYRNLESILSSYLEAASDEAYVILLSDHGFSLHAGGYDHYHIPESMPPPDGIFLMTGPGVKPGRVDVSVYDIAPTVLHLFGLPTGEDMDGAPLTAALSWEREVEKRRYASELMQPRSHERDREIDERTLEELRSLGYIQ